MAFWAQFVSPDEAAVDSIIILGCVAMVALLLFTGYQTYLAPGSFNAMSFGTGTAAVLGAVGAGKRLRDGVNNEPH